MDARAVLIPLCISIVRCGGGDREILPPFPGQPLSTLLTEDRVNALHYVEERTGCFIAEQDTVTTVRLLTSEASFGFDHCEAVDVARSCIRAQPEELRAFELDRAEVRWMEVGLETLCASL